MCSIMRLFCFHDCPSKSQTESDLELEIETRRFPWSLAPTIVPLPIVACPGHSMIQPEKIRMCMLASEARVE